jgi:hypothetical protein
MVRTTSVSRRDRANREMKMRLEPLKVARHVAKVSARRQAEEDRIVAFAKEIFAQEARGEYVTSRPFGSRRDGLILSPDPPIGA